MNGKHRKLKLLTSLLDLSGFGRLEKDKNAVRDE